MRIDAPLNERLGEKVVLITSSSPGTCVDTALQLAREGAKVMICGRNGTQGMDTVKQIRRSGGRATFVLADISITADVQAAVDETIATYGRLDILFNHAASSYSRDGSLLEVSETVWDRVCETLLKGAFFCCQQALPFLQQSGSGTIINLVEQLPTPAPRSAAAICQGAMISLTAAITQQLPQEAVTANLIWAAPHISENVPPALMGGALAQLMPQILRGPVTSDRPFRDIPEAIMYLACHGRTLHGATLLVDTRSQPPFPKNAEI